MYTINRPPNMGGNTPLRRGKRGRPPRKGGMPANPVPKFWHDICPSKPRAETCPSKPRAKQKKLFFKKNLTEWLDRADEYGTLEA